MRRPDYESPINSAKDAVAKNITFFHDDSSLERYKSFMKDLNISEWTKIAQNMVPATECANIQRTGRPLKDCGNLDTDHPFFIKHKVLGNGTHAFLRAYLLEYDVYPDSLKDVKKKFWRSTEKLPGVSSYAGFLTSRRRWLLIEENPRV